MTDAECLRVLSPLTGMFHSWPDNTIEDWIEKLREYRDPDIALAASHEVIDTHEGVTVPFAIWRAAYMRASTRAAALESDKARQLAHPDHKPMTLPEYLTNFLVPRLNAGYQAGIHGDTLADWRRLAARSRRNLQDLAEQRGDFVGVIPTGGLVEWFEDYDKARA